MVKKRHVTFVKFISEEYQEVFKINEIGIIVRPIRSTYRDLGEGKQDYRGGEIVSLDGRKTGRAWEELDYIRIETTPALEILYGKFNKSQA